MKIINHILDNPDDKDFDVSSMLHASMQDKFGELIPGIYRQRRRRRRYRRRDISDALYIGMGAWGIAGDGKSS